MTGRAHAALVGGLLVVAAAIAERGRAEAHDEAGARVAKVASTPAVDQAAPSPPGTSGEASIEAAPPPPIAPPSSDLERDPPEGKSASPSKVEWRTAAPLAIRHLPAQCRAHRVREWVRIRCDVPDSVPEITQIAGSRDGVGFQILERKPGAEVVFPVRRGDRRLVEIDRIAAQWKYTTDFDAALVISEVWLADAKAPVLAVE